MSEPLDLPALDDAASLLDDEQPSIGALDVMKRGLRVSPELRAGLGITVVMALTAASGRLVVPILVQLILDNGVLGDEGYRAGYVWTASLLALAVVLVVAAASRVALMRLEPGQGGTVPGFAAGLIVHPLNPKAWAMIAAVGLGTIRLKAP